MFQASFLYNIRHYNIYLILHLCFQNSELKLQSKANVTVNARSSGGNITGQLFVGNDEVVARNQKFSIKTDQGKSILYADKDKIHFAADKLEFLSNCYFLLFLKCDHFICVWKKNVNSFRCHKFLTVFKIDLVINQANLTFLSTSLEAPRPHSLCTCPRSKWRGFEPRLGTWCCVLRQDI